MNLPYMFFSFLQLVGLMVTASALPIGVMENDPTTQLTIMFTGMGIFWLARSLQGRFVE